MNQHEYNLKIARTIKALRELRRVKQQVLADNLCIGRTSYSKIENGEILLNPGQLKIIAQTMNTSVFQIFAIAEADELINFKSTCLSDILLWFVSHNHEKPYQIDLGEEGLTFIIEKIKTNYYKTKLKDSNTKI
jgi:transcriptional regulator with XRE-family HTH domain